MRLLDWLIRRKRHDSAASPHPWEDSEATARRSLEPALDASFAVATQCEQLAFDLLSGVQQLRHPQEVYRVHATLLARTLQDLRVCAIASRLGYTMQAWAIASSAFEAANTMGFVGTDPERAQRWLAHASQAKSFCDTHTAILGTLRFLEIADASDERNELTRREYELYQYLCMAKHVNPLAEKTRYWRSGERSLRLALTPFASERRVREARLGLALATRAAAVALWVFQRAHVANSDDDPRMLALFEATGKLIDQWDGRDLGPAA